MKRSLISTAAAIACSMIASTALLAQSALTMYDIPFSFNAAGIHMTAGKYTVANNGPGFGMIQGPNSSVSYLRNPNATATSAPAHLTFYKYGNAYFLRQVWDESGRSNFIPVGKQERAIMRAQAAEQSGKTTAASEVVLTAER
jgi:hypothetical protein